MLNLKNKQIYKIITINLMKNQNKKNQNNQIYNLKREITILHII